MGDDENQLFDDLSARLDELFIAIIASQDGSVSHVNSRLDKIEYHLGQISHRLDGLEERLDKTGDKQIGFSSSVF